ncbi:MAG TPA: hypothetical protein VHG35_13905 [Gemmatimonadales bacterium]|nr:hypothetical protein [Gemmatimonadales bacterium]
MIGRGLVVWCLLVVLAVLNGGVRDTWLSPLLGDTVGRAISSLMLSGLILLATWLTIGWIGPRTAGQALTVGAIWLGLTLAFEFGAGHYAFGKSWGELLADYDVSRGRIWILVLIVTSVAPVWAARLRGLLG